MQSKEHVHPSVPNHSVNSTPVLVCGSRLQNLALISGTDERYMKRGYAFTPSEDMLPLLLLLEQVI
jgi:hypothetical protein